MPVTGCHTPAHIPAVPLSVHLPAADSEQCDADPTNDSGAKGLLWLLQDMRCVYPEGRKLDVVELTEHDLSRLDKEEFLNDTVIDFYAK